MNVLTEMPQPQPMTQKRSSRWHRLAVQQQDSQWQSPNEWKAWCSRSFANSDRLIDLHRIVQGDVPEFDYFSIDSRNWRDRVLLQGLGDSQVTSIALLVDIGSGAADDTFNDHEFGVVYQLRAVHRRRIRAGRPILNMT